jgi:hypothetical protein
MFMYKIRKKTSPDMKAKKELLYFVFHYQNSKRNTDTTMSIDSFETLTENKSG